jgi:tRNA uridine 5-carboxymethylaminomethyl modification enzyme
VHEDIRTQVENDIRYAGYIQRELLAIEKSRKMEQEPIPTWVDYDKIEGLKTEARFRLKELKPSTLGQASRISGINPTDVALLSVWIHRGKKSAQEC